MTILTDAEKLFLGVNLDTYYYSDDLRRSLKKWAKDNKINENNYEEKLKDDYGDTINSLCKHMSRLQLDERIKKDILSNTSHKYKGFERWIKATVRGHGKIYENVKETDFWKYTIISLRKLLGVGILESLAEKKEF